MIDPVFLRIEKMNGSYFVYADTDAIYVKERKDNIMKKEAKFKVGDMVRILDGSKIKDFRCGYMDDMKDHIGEVHTISSVFKPIDSDEYPGYRFKNMEYVWDERCIEKVDDVYVVSVSGRNVFVLGNGKMGKARCNPEDRFDLAKGISLALERMDADDKIREGDWVEVVDPGYTYTTLPGWVTENIDDKVKIAKYRYGECPEKYLEGRVLKIANHSIFNDTAVAYVEGYKGCYAIGIKGLKKVKT